jgi:hypothetical protein
MKESNMTKEEAIKMCKSGWWKDKTPDEIVEFQIHEERLCLPFDEFHGAVEKWLGRPIWTHEFADRQALIDEKADKRKAQNPIESLQRIVSNKPIIAIISKE